ncbi:MAG: protein translocase subunit SecF [Firmicutes bacterium]|nr:protein translocase subunit SecF [Bacillota bacterium]
MKKLSIENLLQRENKLVEKRKIFFIIPLAIVLIAFIMGIVHWQVNDSAFNVGMDFTGGHTVQINAGVLINESNFEGHRSNIVTFFNEYTFTDSDGNVHSINLRPENVSRLGSGSSTAIRIEFQTPSGVSRAREAEIMSDITNELAAELDAIFGNDRPVVPAVVTQSGSNLNVRVVYSMPVAGLARTDSFFQSLLGKNSALSGNVKDFNASAHAEDGVFRVLNFTYTGSLSASELATLLNSTEVLTIPNPFAAQALPHASISGAISTQLIVSAVTAVLLALFLMMLYIIFRFEVASGFASILALLHDIIIMFAFMVIFHIEINATFIAVLITVLAYSINNSIIIFDRVRENRLSMYSRDKNVTANQIANKSVVETLGRSINTTFTTLIMIAMVAIVTAIGGIGDMVTFSLPIIIGFTAGLFSSTFLAPSIWSMFRRKSVAPRGTFKRVSGGWSNAQSKAKDSQPVLAAESAE